MSIIGGLDLPRAPIAFDRVDRDRGQAHRGRIGPATRAARRAWLDGLPGGRGGFAVAGWTGWRLVVEELPAAGFLAHLAEPAQTSSLGGPKRRATTDRTDARLLGELLEQGRLPCSWIPPTTHDGIGAITAPTILAELGDARRFAGGDQVVRYMGLDVTVSAADGKPSPGQLSGAGPAGAAPGAVRGRQGRRPPRSPDSASSTQRKACQGGNRATWPWRASWSAGCATPWLGSATPPWPRSMARAGVACGGRTRGWGVPAPRQAAVARPAPAEPCRHGQSVDGPTSPRGRALGGHPIDHLVAGPRWVRAPGAGWASAPTSRSPSPR
jgi:hypothetical protein